MGIAFQYMQDFLDWIIKSPKTPLTSSMLGLIGMMFDVTYCLMTNVIFITTRNFLHREQARGVHGLRGVR